MSVSIGKLTEPSADSATVPIPVLLAWIGRSATHDLSMALAPTGLKPRHINALAALRDGPLSQTDLGSRTGLDPTRLVGLLNDLETAYLVTRRRDPSDRRRHIVALSDAGHARLAAVDAVTNAVERRLTAGLDEAQRAYLKALLTHIAGTIEAGAACGGVSANDC